MKESTAAMASIDLTGKVALVTGASSGLGARFARVLAGAGATVALAARRRDRLAALADEIRASGGRAEGFALDVTRVEGIRGAVAAIESSLGPVDILVNNSGIAATKRLHEVEEAQYDQIMATNLKGAFFVAQAVGRRMLALGIKGRIINVASTAGLRALPQIGIYAMSKAGLIHMTKAMAIEWGRAEINVNAICPGYIATEINLDYWSTDGGKRLIGMLPRRRVGKPEDLDGLILLLSAEESRFINGAIIAADDGLAAG